MLRLTKPDIVSPFTRRQEEHNGSCKCKRKEIIVLLIHGNPRWVSHKCLSLVIKPTRSTYNSEFNQKNSLLAKPNIKLNTENGNHMKLCSSRKQKNKKTPEPCPGKPSSIVSPSAHKSRKMTRFLDYMPQTNFTFHSKTTKNVTRKFIP